MHPITLWIKSTAGMQNTCAEIAEMCSGSCIGTHVAASWNTSLLLEAVVCAKKQLRSLQIHSLGMVVIPSIHSNLIWQSVACMTEPWVAIGGEDEEEVNDAQAQKVKLFRRRIPLFVQCIWVTNLIAHFGIAVYAIRMQPVRFASQYTANKWGHLCKEDPWLKLSGCRTQSVKSFPFRMRI